MTIDETGLTKGLVRKLNALRKSVGDDLAEEVFARWLEREAALQAKSKPDPVAMKIVGALAGFENDPKFNLGNYGYTLRRAKGKGASGFIAYKNLLIHEAQQGCRDATYEPSRFPVAVPYPSPHRATSAYVVVTSSDLDTSRNKAYFHG